MFLLSLLLLLEFFFYVGFVLKYLPCALITNFALFVFLYYSIISPSLLLSVCYTDKLHPSIQRTNEEQAAVTAALLLSVSRRGCIMHVVCSFNIKWYTELCTPVITHTHTHTHTHKVKHHGQHEC